MEATISNWKRKVEGRYGGVDRLPDEMNCLALFDFEIIFCLDLEEAKYGNLRFADPTKVKNHVAVFIRLYPDNFA